MIGKLFSFGLNAATLPARVALNSGKAILAAPGNFNRMMEEVRLASDEAMRDLQSMLEEVDIEMREKTADLNEDQKDQATSLALSAAEQHLSMAAVNMLRALWLATDSVSRKIENTREGVTIEQEG